MTGHVFELTATDGAARRGRLHTAHERFAHRQAAGMSSLGGASGFLRNATFEGHGR